MHASFCMSYRPGFGVPLSPLKTGIATSSMMIPRELVLVLLAVEILWPPIGHRLQCTEVVAAVVVAVMIAVSVAECPSLTIHEGSSLRVDLRMPLRRHGGYNMREIDTFPINDCNDYGLYSIRCNYVYRLAPFVRRMVSIKIMLSDRCS